MKSELVALLFPSDPLLESGPIPISEGLTVLYGLNGAGKTRFLRGLRGALTGERTDVRCALVVKLRFENAVDEDATDPDRIAAYGRPPILAIAAALAGPTGFQWEDLEFAPPEDERVPYYAFAGEDVSRFVQSRLGPESELTSEIIDDGQVIFLPTGSVDSPSWTAWPVADTRRPLASAAIDHLDSLSDAWASVPGDDPAYDEAMAAYEDEVERTPLFPSDQQFVWVSGDRNHAASISPYVAYSIKEREASQVEGIEIRGRLDFGVDVVRETHNVDEVTREHLALLYGLVVARGRSSDSDRTDKYGLRTLNPRVSRRVLSDAPVAPDWSELLASMSQSTEEREAQSRQANEAIAAADRRISELAAELSSRVNRLLGQVLLDAPVAALALSSHVDRFSQPAARWRFGRRSIGVEQLSNAERAWASRAISLALHAQLRDTAGVSMLSRATLFLLDEPESALHRAAESTMSRALRELASAPRFAIVTATHSPELLDAAEAHVFEIQRNVTGYGKSRVVELDVADRESLANLGLNPSDLLRWPRVFLLVEGEHDELMLDCLLGDRLRAARVKVLPLHGGKRLSSTIDSQVLFDHTDAHVVAMLDNVRAGQIAQVWDEAKSAAATGDLNAAKRIVIDGLPDDPRSRGQEYSYLRPWLTKSLDAGLSERVTPFGLEAVDVVRYLPADRVVQGATSWETLDSEHAAHVAATPDGARAQTDFKKWLRSSHKVNFDPQTIRDLATGMPVPHEFEQLMKMVEAYSSQVGNKR